MMGAQVRVVAEAVGKILKDCTQRSKFDKINNFYCFIKDIPKGN